MQCRSVLNLLLWLIGVVLPTVVAAHVAPGTWQPPAPQPAGRQTGHVLEDGGQQRQRWRLAYRTVVHAAHRGLAAAGRGWVQLDAALSDCCRGADFFTVHVLLCCWLLLGNSWLGAKAAAVRSLQASL
jgi:hypothetical protein